MGIAFVQIWRENVYLETGICGLKSPPRALPPNGTGKFAQIDEISPKILGNVEKSFSTGLQTANQSKPQVIRILRRGEALAEFDTPVAAALESEDKGPRGISPEVPALTESRTKSSETASQHAENEIRISEQGHRALIIDLKHPAIDRAAFSQSIEIHKKKQAHQKKSVRSPRFSKPTNFNSKIVKRDLNSNWRIKV